MSSLFFFNDTATTEIYTLSLHDALPISGPSRAGPGSSSTWTRSTTSRASLTCCATSPATARDRDRKSTRLNSSHANISYAVFCLKKKKTPHHLYSLDEPDLYIAVRYRLD